MPWLYFLRHGIAEPDGVDPGLTAEGMRLMRLEAEGMVRLGLKFDAVFTSPLQRARQTAAIVAEWFGVAGRVSRLEALAPGCRLAALAGLGDEEQGLLLVGHAPDLGRIAGALTGAEGGLHLGRGGIAGVELAAWPPTPPGRLGFFVPAEMLIAAAGRLEQDA